MESRNYRSSCTTPVELITKMSDGNPGAATVLMEMVSKGRFVDPQSLHLGFGGVFTLDTLGIYGTDIYVLWSDICGKQLNKTLAVLRAHQLGLFDGDTIKDACSRQDYSGRNMIPVEELYLKVKEQLTDFDK